MHVTAQAVDLAPESSAIAAAVIHYRAAWVVSVRSRMHDGIMIRTIFHADWSISPKKRWCASAIWTGAKWRVTAPMLVPGSDRLIEALRDATKEGAVLAGFDFPIGLPSAYGVRTGLADFSTAVSAFGEGIWSDFYNVSEDASQIAITRPFYPRRSLSAKKQSHLVDAHGVDSINDLRRRCELRTSDRAAACSLFWTLGGNQVGKAAIAGWREVIVPARRAGAMLWPFDGDLISLSSDGNLILAETYPGEAYRHIGVKFARAESKRRQHDRLMKASAILEWSERVELDPAMRSTIETGFGSDRAGEDRFDAAMGLFGMIEVVSGGRSEGTIRRSDRAWEGWIFGQEDPQPALD